MGFFDFSDSTNEQLFFEECKTPAQTQLFGETIEKYHSYVKYVNPPQRRLNWNVYETKSGNHVGAIGLSSCVLAIAARDSWIGWDKDDRISHSNNVANNYRFCLIQNNITIPQRIKATLGITG